MNASFGYNLVKGSHMVDDCNDDPCFNVDGSKTFGVLAAGSYLLVARSRQVDDAVSADHKAS